MTTSLSKYDIAIVGAGFAGLYALYKLRNLGLSVRVFEAGNNVGGTWYWNRFPGARCDVNSLEYSYQFSSELQQEWCWSEKYSPQSEILEYVNHVTDRFDLRKDIQFGTRIVSLLFDEKSDTWLGESEKGERFQANYCVMATGCLSKENIPKFNGFEDFTGTVLHTGKWPHKPVDFSSKQVGIIGTGSSAVQAIPIIAEQAETLTVFQRTATFSIPAHNAPMDKNHEKHIKNRYAEFRAENSRRYTALNNRPNHTSALDVEEEARIAVYEDRWQLGGLPFQASFNDLGISLEANKTAVDFVTNKIHEIVNNPEVAEILSPSTVLGCKRLCVDSGYYETYNRENVTLVDVSEAPITRITKNGLQTSSGEYWFDTLILATGFDAMTGALLSIDIRGRDNFSLREKWKEGPANYLGLTIAGFPNLFTITGPGSPSVLANMIVGIEQHVDWIADCLTYLQTNNLRTVEASAIAEKNWVNLVNEIANETLYPTGCNSWYTGANIPGKPRIFMPYLGYPSYVEKCNDVAENGYRGFVLK